MPCTRIGSAMIWPTVMRGLSEEYGSWKMTCIFLRTATISLRSSCARSTPSKRISPAVGIVEPQHQAAEGGLPAAQLADQAQRLAALDIDA